MHKLVNIIFFLNPLNWKINAAEKGQLEKICLKWPWGDPKKKKVERQSYKERRWLSPRPDRKFSLLLYVLCALCSDCLKHPSEID